MPEVMRDYEQADRERGRDALLALHGHADLIGIDYTHVPTARRFVVDIDGVVVATIDLYKKGTTAIIDQLFVHPDFTGDGRASRLMDHLLATLAARGITRVMAAVRVPQMKTAFESKGFAVDHSFDARADFLPDDFVMGKTL